MLSVNIQQVLVQLLFELIALAQHGLHGPEDEREWRAQLVADVGEELRLDAVEILQLLVLRIRADAASGNLRNAAWT